MTTDRIADYGIAVNTDIELHREGSILNEKTLFKTREGSVGMSVGGLTIVKPLSAWHALAVEASARALKELSEDKIRQLVFEHVNTQALYQTCIAFAHAAIAADRALNNPTTTTKE